jgi:hypothetical protein
MTVQGQRRENYTDKMSDDKWARRDGNYKHTKQSYFNDAVPLCTNN